MRIMALSLNFQNPTFFFPNLPPRTVPLSVLRIGCLGNPDLPSLVTAQNCDQTALRRSANYHPSIWDFDFVQSLRNDYTGEKFDRRAEKLKEGIRHMLLTSEEMDLAAKLELISSMERLGLGYIFKEDIKRVLDNITSMASNLRTEEEGLHIIALCFRILRQHGYQISQDVFSGFMGETGSFEASFREDIKGILSLYEASHLGLEGEEILDEARVFTSRALMKISETVGHELLLHSLDLPLHWRVPRLEARWYIDMCARENSVHPDLLELARLDFNRVQAKHQDDLKEVMRWWRDIGLGSKLRFIRDRLVENFLWTAEMFSNSQFEKCRKGITKVTSLIVTIDDVYDVYGYLDELELFTDAVERWDISAIKQLPYYLKVCFLALYNTVNEMGYNTLKDQGWDSIPYIQKAWADLCRSYLVEATWYLNKYTPTLEEYLENAWISIAGPVVLVNAYFLLEQEITQEALDCLENYPDLIRHSSMIFRLTDDLATSSAELERGDVPKSIQCYMNETGATEEVARDHIRLLISDTWKKMNKDHGVSSSLYSQSFIEAAMNLARMAQCIYQYGDGFGIPDQETKERVLSLLVQPLKLYE